MGDSLFGAESEDEGYSTLTVFESSSSTIETPINLSEINYRTNKCQFVYPAYELEDVAGGIIRGMRFHINGLDEKSRDWSPASFKVSLKEVESEKLSKADDLSGATVVYEGLLGPTGMTVDMMFTKPYEYHGGNLLACVENVTTSSRQLRGSFRGIYRLGVSIFITPYTSTDSWYLPMTTFFYDASHDHILHYLSNGDSIRVECENEDCYLNEREIKILPPENLVCDGQLKAATIEPGYSKVAFPEDYKISYTKDGNPIDAAEVVGPGLYTASISMQSATATTEFALHEHKYVYTATGDTVTATCEGSGGTCEQPIQSLAIVGPSDLDHDGRAKAATLTEGYSKTAFPDDYQITYTKDGEPIAAHDVVEPGTYVASVAVGDATASTVFTISSDFEGLYKYCVCDGAKVEANNVVYNDQESSTDGSKSGFVYPKEMLGLLKGKTIGSLRFYVKDRAKTAYGDGKRVFSVLLKEVDNATVTSLDELEGATLVYKGPLDASGEYMDVVLSNGYEYGGGNLMVVVRYDGKNEFDSPISWYGIEHESGDMYGVLYHGRWWKENIRNFLPKLTFGYSLPHEHSFTYSADGDTITAVCANEKCALTGNTFTLMPPSKLVCDGKAKEAVPKEGYNKIAFGEVRISYAMDGEEVEASEVAMPGSYTAIATIGGASASVSYDLVPATLTVADGKDVSWQVPVWGVSVGRYIKSQHVIPADMLQKMKGSTVSHMRFYVARMGDDSWPWSDAVFTVSLREVDADTISSFDDLSESTVVYEGPLTPTSEYLDVPFTKFEYYYGGKNLLVNVHNTQTGLDCNVEFFGISREGASVENRGSSLDSISATQRNFLPKTTFTYAPDVQDKGGDTTDAAGEPEDGPVQQKPEGSAGSSTAAAATKAGATNAGSTSAAATTASRNATATAKTSDTSVPSELAAMLAIIGTAVLMGVRKVRHA